MGCPVRYTIGNHDFCGEPYGEALYERYYGPTWYSFDYGRIHFVALSIKKGDKPSGYALSDQWIWLQEDLKRVKAGQKIIVLDHDLCSWVEKGFCPTVEGVTVKLREAGLIAWLYGHYHFNFLHDYDGVLNVCSSRPDSGGIDSSVAGVRKLSVVGEMISSEMLYYMGTLDSAEDSVWCTRLKGRVEATTPIEAEGDIFIATMDDGFPKECGIYRLNEATGAIRWFYSTSDGIKNDIAYDEGKIYAQDTKGILYCINAESGELLWSQSSPLPKSSCTRTGVLIVKELVITGSPSYLYAYHKNLGVMEWRQEICVCENTPARIVYDEWRNQLLVSCQWKGLCALDADSGALKWMQDQVPLWFRTTTPTVTESELFVAGQRHITKVDPNTGEYLLVHEIGGRVDVNGAPAIDQDSIYVPTFTDGVVRLDRQTLTEQGRFLPGKAKLRTSPYAYWDGNAVEGTPILRGTELIFAGLDGFIYRYNTVSGELLQKISVGAPIIAPLYGNGTTLIAADFCGRITKFTV